MSAEEAGPVPTMELEGWAGRVLRLLREAEGSAAVGGLWGPYDLVGACHNRDRLATADGASTRTLDAVDELFRRFTVEVGTGWVDAIGLGDEKGAGWWWGRVPRQGPVPLELLERGFQHDELL